MHASIVVCIFYDFLSFHPFFPPPLSNALVHALLLSFLLQQEANEKTIRECLFSSLSHIRITISSLLLPPLSSSQSFNGPSSGLRSIVKGAKQASNAVREPGPKGIASYYMSQYPYMHFNFVWCYFYTSNLYCCSCYVCPERNLDRKGVSRPSPPPPLLYFSRNQPG